MEVSHKPRHYSATLHDLYFDILTNKNTSFDQFEYDNKKKLQRLTQINFDPLKARYFDKFQKSWHLEDKEIAVLKKNGFVVSERLGAKAFGNAYLEIYNNDLPVFITADSMLHCWHDAYDRILENLEADLSKLMVELLRAMYARLMEIPHNSQNELFATAHFDAQYYLLVALNLITASKVSVVVKDPEEFYYYKKKKPVKEPEQIHSSNPIIDSRVMQTLDAVEAMEMQEFILFGKKRYMDFSQFKPRGHYEKSADLQRYFKCLMWLGRIDLRITGGRPGESSITELGCALLLFHLISSPNEFAMWSKFDEVMQEFIGSTDSLTFRDIKELTLKLKSEIPSDLNALFETSRLESIQKAILSSDFGKQTITSHIYQTVAGSGPHPLPRAWTFMGQRFTIDSWVLSQLVFSKVDERLIPSCVEVGYATFRNDQCGEILINRMKNPEKQWRDQGTRGPINISNELHAARSSIDAIPEDVWNSNLYTLWLKALRTLSNAASSPNADKYPETMKTKVWAYHDMNTQFGSWTELRHDTILYVKQSYSDMMTLCDYPYGFVDPRVEFWDVLIQMGQKMQDALNKIKSSHWPAKWLEVVTKLRNLAQKELDQQPFSNDENRWLKCTIAKWYEGGSGGGWNRDGWYCGLFYDGDTESEKWDPVVADIHTAPPSPDFGFPGTVVTQGVGNVNMMIAALNNGNDLVMYAGPVFSHYEITPDGIKRYSDSEWKDIVKVGQKASPELLASPPWTKEYLIPTELPINVEDFMF